MLAYYMGIKFQAVSNPFLVLVNKCQACEQRHNTLFNLKDGIKYPLGFLWIVSKEVYKDSKYIYVKKISKKVDAPLVHNTYLCETCLKLTLNNNKNFNENGVPRYS